MKHSLSICPKCSETLVITQYECPRCQTRVSGSFEIGGTVAELSSSQMELLKTFISTYGNISEVAKKLGISRPTARIRIRELGETLNIKMSYEEGEHPASVLESLEKGEINIDEALEKIKGR